MLPDLINICLQKPSITRSRLMNKSHSVERMQRSRSLMGAVQPECFLLPTLWALAWRRWSIHRLYLHWRHMNHGHCRVNPKRLGYNPSWKLKYVFPTFPAQTRTRALILSCSSGSGCSLSTAEHRRTGWKCRGEPLAWSAPHLRRSTKSIKWSMFPRSFGSVPAPEAFPLVSCSSWVLLQQLFPLVYTPATTVFPSANWKV